MTLTSFKFTMTWEGSKCSCICTVNWIFCVVVYVLTRSHLCFWWLCYVVKDTSINIAMRSAVHHCWRPWKEICFRHLFEQAMQGTLAYGIYQSNTVCAAHWHSLFFKPLTAPSPSSPPPPKKKIQGLSPCMAKYPPTLCAKSKCCCQYMPPLLYLVWLFWIVKQHTFFGCQEVSGTEDLRYIKIQ